MNKNILIALLLSVTLFSCTSKKGDMIVEGTIIGLQKGTLYLQKMQDTLLVSIDSVRLIGENTFTLVDQNTEPQFYFLTLLEKEEEKIGFFGEKGTITINTKLEKFYDSAEINGSKSNDLLNEYNEMIGKFNNKRLDLFKESFDAQQAKDNELIEKIDKDLQRLIKKRYLYTTNFSVNNGKSEVAPYLALTELFDANISLLDTVNNSLSNKVKKSIYGQKLENFIKNIKENEE
jgi:hypothetical protein